MSYKNLKTLAIVAVIFGAAGIGWGIKANNAAQHPSRSGASGPEVIDRPGTTKPPTADTCKGIFYHGDCIYYNPKDDSISIWGSDGSFIVYH